MNLRHKFGIMALIYVVALSANLLMSAWCILVYFQSAFEDFQATGARRSEIEWVRSLVRRQIKVIDDEGDPADLAGIWKSITVGLDRLQTESSSGLNADLLGALRDAAEDSQEAVKQWVHETARSAGEIGPLTLEEREPFRRLDGLLSQAATGLGGEQEAAMQRAGLTQERVVAILSFNAGCGMVLCVLGVLLVKRWVLRPVEDLRTATKEISLGHFEYRMEPRSRDELGQFAEEVNAMAGTIVSMQAKLVEQERLAAAGEMVTRLAHNIRNPLAGIRGLAEETIQVTPENGIVVDTQRRIIDSIDRFEKWLRDLQKSVSPLTLNPHRICLKTLVDNVCTALRPMADRRKVSVRVEVPASMPEVELDDVHFEQVLVALVTNALQASKDGQSVRVQALPSGASSDQWKIKVVDEGMGIPFEIQDKIFQPYFTTKVGGNGVGLAMANKVVKLHGGRLTVDSELGRGATFTIDMPGLVRDEE